jgi:sec-independent protein translocase protein TatA
MPDIGGWEWVIIAIVALVLFGGTKLASVGKNAGRAIREFKEEVASPTPNQETPQEQPVAAPQEETVAPSTDTTQV